MKNTPLRLRLVLLSVLLLAAGLSGVAWVESPNAAIPVFEDVGAITPRISPNAEWVAFSYQGTLWSTHRTGGTMRRLTRGQGFHMFPAWSPDGKRIAYVDNWHTGRLRIIGREGGAPVEHGVKSRISGRPTFHPDGKRILAHENQREGYVLTWFDLKSGEKKALRGPERRMPVVALSSDGSKIAFATHQDVRGEQGGHDGPEADLWIMPSSGGEPKKLTRTRSRVYHLEWSGDHLYYSSDYGGAHNNIWRLSVKNPNTAEKLTSGLADQDAPSISASGRWMVHADNSQGATALAIQDVHTGRSRPLGIRELSFETPHGSLSIGVVDKAGKLVTARLSVEKAGGGYFAPPGSLYRMDGRLVHFYADATSFPVPAGKYTVRAFRGMEYREWRQDIEVPEGGMAKVAVKLERWIDPEAMSWYSGESHIHANYGYGHWYNTPETMARQVQGEGLNVANFVIANSDTDGIFDREFWRGSPDPVSTPRHVLYWNEEFRATLWGHMTLYNLRELVEPIMTGFKNTTNPYDHITNADIADFAHVRGGHVNYTHPANNADPFLHAYSAKEMPVDVALGKIDSLDINGSFTHTVPLWYRLLNCGFKLPASAGTDCFLNRIRSRRPGQDRAYVPVKGAFSYAAWVKGLKEGKSFVTNGPWLEFAAGGKTLGETVRLENAGTVPVTARARANAALKSLELVYNGKVVATGKLSDDKKAAAIDAEIPIEAGGWMSLRAYGTGYNTQAHTSPIYVEVAGKGAASAEDATYFLGWIDRLEAKLRERDRVPTAKLMEHVMSILNAARDVYRGLTR